MTAPSRKPAVKLVHGKATTTSLKVAEAFGKQHNLVLRAIANLDCSPEFRLCNFAQSSYMNQQGKEQPSITLTKDGFVFLCMGFKGPEAAHWKEKYIQAFNDLEKRALNKAASRHTPKTLPPPPRALPGQSYHYPRSLLDQDRFSTPATGKAILRPAMLANIEHFISPLLALLNQLRSEGHDVSGPLDEAIALRNALRIADSALDEISTRAIRCRFNSVEA